MSLGVLLVEDDRELRATLRQALTVEGYRVLAAASVADAWALWNTAAHDAGLQDAGVQLVLLDLTLPDGDGASFLQTLRASAKGSTVPVIVISARHAEADKVGLLDVGADDYLVKPFGIRELLARMRVTLRHRGHPTQAAVLHYTWGDVAVDLGVRSVMRAGEAVRLTPTEYALLARLVRNAGQVVTHRQLLTDVWGPAYSDHTHYLRLYVAQLRSKLEPHPTQPQLLLNEPGVGYRLAEPEGTR